MEEEIRYNVYVIKGECQRAYAWKEPGDKVRKGLFGSIESAFDRIELTGIAEKVKNDYDEIAIREVRLSYDGITPIARPGRYVERYSLKPKKEKNAMQHD